MARNGIYRDTHARVMLISFSVCRCTVCDLNTLKQENSILVQIRAIGLVPVEAITEIGPDAL